MKTSNVFNMNQRYPFEECKANSKGNMEIFVKKVYTINKKQKRNLLKNLTVLETLNHKTMIKLQFISKSDDHIQILYQHVPVKLQTCLSNMNQQIIKQIRNQIIHFFTYLASKNIEILFQLKNIGIDRNYHAKYYLDLSFVINNQLKQSKLKSQYIRQIVRCFRPYLINKNEEPQFQLLLKKQNQSQQKKLFKFKKSKNHHDKNQKEYTIDSSNAQQYSNFFSRNTLEKSFNFFDLSKQKKQIPNEDYRLSYNEQYNKKLYNQINKQQQQQKYNYNDLKIDKKHKLNHTLSWKNIKNNKVSKDISQLNIISKFLRKQQQLKLKTKVKDLLERSQATIKKFKSIDNRKSINKTLKIQKL